MPSTQNLNPNSGVEEIPDLKRLLIETGWITDQLEYVPVVAVGKWEGHKNVVVVLVLCTNKLITNNA